jgi:hypothetical protein
LNGVARSIEKKIDDDDNRTKAKEKRKTAHMTVQMFHNIAPKRLHLKTFIWLSANPASELLIYKTPTLSTAKTHHKVCKKKRFN